MDPACIAGDARYSVGHVRAIPKRKNDVRSNSVSWAHTPRVQTALGRARQFDHDTPQGRLAHHSLATAARAPSCAPRAPPHHHRRTTAAPSPPPRTAGTGPRNSGAPGAPTARRDAPTSTPPNPRAASPKAQTASNSAIAPMKTNNT